MKEKPVNPYDTVLSMSIAGLRFCGIWSLNSSASIYFKYLHILSSIFGIMAVLHLTVAIAADLFYNSNDLLIVTDNGCYLAGLSVILFKVYKFHSHHEQIQKLTKAIYTPIRNLRRSTDDGVLTILKTNTFYENIGFTFFTSMGGILMIALIFFVPKNEGELPIRAAYPVNTTVSPIFQLAFSIQMYAVAYGLTAILLMDTIGLGFMRWINVQFIILTYNYQNCIRRSFQKDSHHSSMSAHTVELIKNPQGSRNVMNIDKDPTISTFAPFLEDEFENMGEDFISRFKRCVINHQRLIDIVDDINAIFATSMLMQLFASFSMICLTGFQAVLGAKEKSNLLKFAIYLGAAFTQLLYWCWYGNELYYQKHSLLMAQWMSGWENHLNSTSKILIIVSMARTMRPLQLKAGSFFVMSMETFITVVKSSYSIFALLSTLTIED